MSRRGENIYKRKDGRWEGRYPKGRKYNGHLYYGYVYGKTYTETKRKLSAKRSDYTTLQGEKIYYSGTVSEWFFSFFEKEEQIFKPSTIASYMHKSQKYILPYLGEYKLIDIRAEHIDKMMSEWDKLNLASTTIQIIVLILKKVLTEAKKSGILSTDLYEHLSFPKIRKKRVYSLTRKEQQQLERVAIRNKAGLPTLLALHTGLRIGEISALSWEDIDFSEDIIKIQNTYQRVPLQNGNRKTKLICGPVKSASSKRKIPISANVKEWLILYGTNSQKGYLFSINDRPMEPRMLTYHFHKLREKAGLPNIHFHQLRHTFATRCLEGQGDIASISALLGHSSVKMTLDVYTDSLLEQRKKTIDWMELSVDFNWKLEINH